MKLAKIAFPLGILLFFVFFIVGCVLFSVFTLPYSCPSARVLRPGGQGSCNRSMNDMYYDAEVTSDNGTSSLVTYVFNKEPKRIFVEEHFDRVLRNEDYAIIYVPSIPDAVYSFKIDVDDEISVYFRTPKHGKNSGTVYYKQKSVTKAEGTYTARYSNSDAYFLLSGWHEVSGTFSLTVKWPQWDVTSRKPVAKCSSYPCDWKFADNPWSLDTDLWFVTVNEGTKDYDVRMALYTNPAIWVTVPVLLIALAFVCFFGGIAVFLVFRK